MGDRRRGSYGNWEQRWSGKPPRHGRPSHPQGASSPSIPIWEKRFVTEKCKIPWWKVCETKNMMYVFKNVFEWDDSGALETLENAKSRYWAEVNGLPCDIPLPDPYMFIDEVDYDAIVDPELIAELDKRPPEPVDDVDCSVPWDRPIVPTGWGDEEDLVPAPNKNTDECQIVDWNNDVKTPIVPTGWGVAEDPYPSGGGRPAYFNDAWNSGFGGNFGGSTNSWSYNAGWEHSHANSNTWGDGWGDSWDNGRNRSWSTNRNDGPSRGNGRRRDGDRAGFRSARPRYEDDDYRMADYRGEKRGRNRGHNSYNKTVRSNRPVAFNLWKHRSSGSSWPN